MNNLKSGLGLKDAFFSSASFIMNRTATARIYHKAMGNIIDKNYTFNKVLEIEITCMRLFDRNSIHTLDRRKGLFDPCSNKPTEQLRC